MTAATISKTNYNLLGDIIYCTKKGDNRLFDKRDNTFLKSNRDIAKILGVTPSKVDRLFRELKKLDLVRDVINVHGDKLRILKPQYLWLHNKFEYQFANAVFHLGSHQEAVEWRRMCATMDCLIDPCTGEIIDEAYDWSVTQDYAEDYNKKDRCYRPNKKKSFEVEEFVSQNTTKSKEDVRLLIDTMDLSWTNK